nr:MAG TPA: hypothetical protein [Caudoviricetes sp.]
MKKLTREQLEIRNLTLTDCIKAAVCVLSDQTTDEYYRLGYTAGLLDKAEKEVEQNIAMGRFAPLKKWKILYANGSVGYQLYSKDLAIEVAEKKKAEYGGSYTIEEITEGEKE